MREKFAATLFIIILAFLAVFFAAIFNKLFIEVDNKFTDSASAAFLGAFLAFIFVRFGDFFKSYSDRTIKNHSALVKLQHTLNGFLTTLDDNIFIIETFEGIYKNYKSNNTPRHVFIWANKLHPVEPIDDLILELINIDLINELYTLNIHLKKLNESMDTINGAYKESKEAMIAERIDETNYMANVERIHQNLLEINNFLYRLIEESKHSLASIRVLAKKQPLLGYVLRRVAGHKYRKGFNSKRDNELLELQKEIESVKAEGQSRINER